MVVDVQGVGDMYTDPQVHSASDKGFGSGNLGIRGMALFFSTHKCNNLCKWMHLTPFRLASGEKKLIHDLIENFEEAPRKC